MDSGKYGEYGNEYGNLSIIYRKTVFDLEYDCEIIIGINRLAITESEYSLLKAIVCANHGEKRYPLDTIVDYNVGLLGDWFL